jgi:hypothetical protein
MQEREVYFENLPAFLVLCRWVERSKFPPVLNTPCSLPATVETVAAGYNQKS